MSLFDFKKLFWQLKTALLLLHQFCFQWSITNRTQQHAIFNLFWNKNQLLKKMPVIWILRGRVSSFSILWIKFQLSHRRTRWRNTSIILLWSNSLVAPLRSAFSWKKSKKNPQKNFIKISNKTENPSSPYPRALY
jgi:hypothetical protein